MQYTCEQCSKAFQAPPCQKARFCNRKCYDKSREGVFACDNCSKNFTYYKSHKKGKLVFCSVKCQLEKMQGELHPRWKGKDYRYIFEKFIGRKLKTTDVIHHINGDHSDNRIENLMLTDRAGHCKIHLPRLGTGKSKSHPFPVHLAINWSSVI